MKFKRIVLKIAFALSIAAMLYCGQASDIYWWTLPLAIASGIFFVTFCYVNFGRRKEK